MTDSSGVEKAREHRGAMAASLHEWAGRSLKNADYATERHSLEDAYLVEGPGAGATLTLSADTRATPWVLDLEREARRLSICESGAVILRDVAGARWVSKPIGCGSKLCPVCCRARATRATARWRAVLEAATRDGAVLRHWTFTQPVKMAPGGLITPKERRYGWRGTVAADGVTGRAVGGEGLGEGYGRLRSTLTSFRDNRSSRDIVKPALGGHLVGCEWTGRDPKTKAPRGHVHVHVLGCSTPDVVVDELAVRQAWVRLTSGSLLANKVRTVESGSVREVLKYPFKPAHLTSAQRIETLAYMRGMHPHHTSGAWSRLSRAYKTDERWARWLAERPEDPDFRRLHRVIDPKFDAETGHWHGPLELWTGSPSEGWHVWALRDPGSRHGWRTWSGRAEPFVELLGRDPKTGGVEPDLEPGSDEAEDWFRDD